MQNKTTLSITALYFAFVFLCSQANATLIDRGNGFIYDDVLDVTWYDYTHRLSDWNSAITWADELTLTFPDTGVMFTGWRLPTTQDSPYGEPYIWGTSGIPGDGNDPEGISHNWGYNLINGELGYLFYEELGNYGGYNPDGSLPTDWGLMNTGPFTNLIDESYWTSTSYKNYPTDAWLFNFYNGCLKKFMKSGSIYAIALHDGDISNPNTPPIIEPILNQVIEPGVLFEFAVNAYDPDAEDTITLGADYLPPGAYFDNETGVFSWIPPINGEANYLDLEFFAQDDGNPIEISKETITITVGLETNRPPEFFEKPAIQSVHEYTTVDLSIEAPDPDGDQVRYYAANLPEGSSFDSDTGNFLWTPNSEQLGYYPVTFVAYDTTEPTLTDQLDIIITVSQVSTTTELTDIIINEVHSYALPQDLDSSYCDSLGKAKDFIARGKTNPATNNLDKFINKVSADIINGNIAQANGDYLIYIATDLRGRL